MSGVWWLRISFAALLLGTLGGSTNDNEAFHPRTGGQGVARDAKWGDREMYKNSAWARRAAGVAGMIQPGSTLLDLGCGEQMYLRGAMPAGADWNYIPADIEKWTPETIQCDLNTENWPQPTEPVQTVTALGVIEYVDDFKAFFKKIRQYNATVILTYQVVPFSLYEGETKGHNPTRLRYEGTPYERKHSLYLHELVEAASAGGFVVGWLRYLNANVKVGTTSMKEDEVLIRFLPVSRRGSKSIVDHAEHMRMTRRDEV